MTKLLTSLNLTITTGIILSLPMIVLGLGLVFLNDRNRKNS